MMKHGLQFKKSRHLAGTGTAAIALLLAACGGGGGGEAASQPTTAQPTVSFGVLGDVSVHSDGTVAQESLDQLGLTADRLEAMSQSPGTGSDVAGDGPIPDRAAPSGAYAIVNSWKDRMGNTIVLRKGYYDGVNGFGLAKVSQKHNLTEKAVWAATAGPPTRTHVAGTKYDYFAPVLHVECSGWWIFRRCRVTEQTTVMTSVDFRTVTDGKSFGVVTAFCVGIDGACPNWVKNAINI